MLKDMGQMGKVTMAKNSSMSTHICIENVSYQRCIF